MRGRATYETALLLELIRLHTGTERTPSYYKRCVGVKVGRSRTRRRPHPRPPHEGGDLPRRALRTATALSLLYSTAARTYRN